MRVLLYLDVLTYPCAVNFLYGLYSNIDREREREMIVLSYFARYYLR